MGERGSAPPRSEGGRPIVEGKMNIQRRSSETQFMRGPNRDLSPCITPFRVSLSGSSAVVRPRHSSWWRPGGRRSAELRQGLFHDWRNCRYCPGSHGISGRGYRLAVVDKTFSIMWTATLGSRKKPPIFSSISPRGETDDHYST